MMKLTEISSSLIALLCLLNAGCTSRIEEPVYSADSTITYPAKTIAGVTASIQLYRKTDTQSGELIGEGHVFTLSKDGNVRALVKIENLFDDEQQSALIHLDWIDPDGRSIFRKQLDLINSDSINAIESSISTSPERRLAGVYELRVYYFRELIAGKRFEILPILNPSSVQAKKIEAHIVLHRKTSKSTGKLIGEGTVFTMKNGRHLRAHVDLGNRFAFGNHDLDFRLEWIGTDNRTFYQKKIILFPNDSTSTLASSISINPNKRKAGTYLLRLSLSDQIVAEQPFVLQLKAQSTPGLNQ